jgi:hypothetical protein
LKFLKNRDIFNDRSWPTVQKQDRNGGWVLGEESEEVDLVFLGVIVGDNNVVLRD